MFLREWVMFSGAGIGLAKGRFTLHRADGAVTMSPLEVVALPSYLALPLNRRIYEPADLKAFAARICNDPRETARLSFEGSVGTFAGWRRSSPMTFATIPHKPDYGDALP